MCGRFTITIDLEEIKHYFELNLVEGDYYPLYNAAPAQAIPVIHGNRPRVLSFSRWGLIPAWAKDISIGHKLINARAESLREKPSFRHAFKRRRCLIPGDGFYEWEKTKTGKKPYRIILKNKEPFAMAGLWEAWLTPLGEPLFTCTIITTEANELVQPLHNRMPVIIPPERWETWLNPQIHDFSLLQSYLEPYPAQEMSLYPVSTLVNSPANNDPQLIEPV
ncbi:MAG: SOS response-associated peptidase [Bacillota bacterium]|jgi:putative SOS response-associated peptidase YedK|uniref:Abasic site processing protein n=1 Tax=Thermanaerosceptrum fracticalcis TaxID=1712410 RepID=A0A7G6DYH0_THEFR|nr:SOS response-associated peptidase [Thermanaerosceptrum fracticalcis]QNB44874.1 SOS response-associated peptidase [Thermanaerosceptrum fracticalcis]